MDPVVILATDSVSAGPGEEARLPVRVRNQGRRVESYRIELVGEPSRFATIDPSTVSVLPGKEAEVSITFRPPTGATTPTGSLPFGVRAVSEVGSSSSAVAEGRLELAGAAGLQAWADNTAATGRWSAKYHLTFANQGNAAVRLAVTAHDPASTLKFTMSDEVVDVPPGGQVATELRAKTRQPFLRGSPVNRMFTVSSQDFPFGATRPVPGQAPPPDDPHARTFQLSFQQKPILSKLAILAALLVVGLIVALVLVNLQDKDDVVLDMAVPASPPDFDAQAVGSNEILLTWGAVPNAAGYVIFETDETGQRAGPALGEPLDAATLRLSVEAEPDDTRCFAVQATGPEGEESSGLSTHDCVTTDPIPELQAPTNFVAEETAPGSAMFNVSWEYPEPIDVTFSVFSFAEELASGIDELSTTVQVPRSDVTFDAELYVRAFRGEGEQSDKSNVEVRTIEPAPPGAPETSAAPTTAPGGAGTTIAGGDPGGGPGVTDPGATTVAPPTTGVTPTTGPPVLAQDNVKDMDATWAAVIGEVIAVPAGTGEEARRASLAEEFGIAPERILTFSNRDTVATDATGDLIPTIRLATPETVFFYVEQLDEGSANGFCDGRGRCDPMILEGAGKAAVGTEGVIILGGLDLTAELDAVNAAVKEQRTSRSRQEIHAIDTTRRPELGSNRIVVVADGFATPEAVQQFCVANPGLTRCEPIPVAR